MPRYDNCNNTYDGEKFPNRKGYSYKCVLDVYNVMNYYMLRACDD